MQSAVRSLLCRLRGRSVLARLTITFAALVWPATAYEPRGGVEILSLAFRSRSLRHSCSEAFALSVLRSVGVSRVQNLQIPR
jgi:hypothetical protein